MLREDKLIHIFLDWINCVQVVLNVEQYSCDLLVDINELAIDSSYILFCLLTFFEDMVVAFVFLELKWFDDEWEVVVDLFQLTSIELFRLN